jgi:hypothetical protein
VLRDDEASSDSVGGVGDGSHVQEERRAPPPKNSDRYGQGRKGRRPMAWSFPVASGSHHDDSGWSPAKPPGRTPLFVFRNRRRTPHAPVPLGVFSWHRQTPQTCLSPSRARRTARRRRSPRPLKVAGTAGATATVSGWRARVPVGFVRCFRNPWSSHLVPGSPIRFRPQNAPPGSR